MARKKKETPVSPPVVDLQESEIYGGLHESEIYGGLHEEELKRSHRDIQALLTKKNVETANVQNAYKAMKSKGGDTDAYKWAAKLLGMDRSTAIVRFRLFLEMLCRLDPGQSQGDMFGDEQTFADVAADVAARFGAAPAPAPDPAVAVSAVADDGQAEPWAVPSEEDEGEDAAERDSLTAAAADTGADDDDEAEGPAYDIGETLADADDPALSDGGVIYNAGYQAGVDGEAEDACPQVNPTAAALWQKGHAKGLAARSALIGTMAPAEAAATAPVH